MKKTGFIAMAVALTSFGANADTVVTSKTYVDNTRQAKITAGTTGTVATYNGTDSNGGAIFSSKAVFSDTTASNYVDSTHSSYLPTMGAVMAQINGVAASVLPSGSANHVLQYNATASAWESVAMDSAPTGSSVKPVTSGGVYDALEGKQDNLGGNGNGGKVVTATDTAGTVNYTTIKTTVDTSADLITAGAVKTYADSKVSTDTTISSSDSSTAPNQKAVYDSINTVQTAVTALQNCKHTCANSGCTLIDVDCIDTYAG